MVYIHSYGGEAVFFESLGRGRLMATRCDNPGCESRGTVYQPFRIHCSDCLGRNTVFDMTELAQKTARVHTFMVCERSGAFNVLEKPIKFINIEFDGVATILMSYLSVGRPEIGHARGAHLPQGGPDLHHPRPVLGAGGHHRGRPAPGVRLLGAEEGVVQPAAALSTVQARRVTHFEGAPCASMGTVVFLA